jgi:two-component system cell cycle sensor histidine kinase/response regulator CckA
MKGTDSSLLTATRVARLGGWAYAVKDRQVSWSGETAAIHDEPAGFSPALDGGFDYYVPEFRPVIRQAFDACVGDGTPFTIEAQILTGKGRLHWVRVMGEAVRAPTGEIEQVQGALQDISEQREAAEQIRTLSSRLHDVLETLSDAFFTLDRTWRFSFLNSAAERMLERPRAELLGHVIWDEFKQAVGTESDRAYHRVMDQGETVNFEQYYPPLKRWFEAKAYPSREGVAVYFRDVTARHDNEARLLEQATLLDKANDAIVVRGLDHRILFWNQSAERIYGWTSTEALGGSIYELLHPDLKQFNAATEATLATGEWTGELEQQTKDRRPLTVEARWTLVRDDRGRPKSILAINTDITQSKKLEVQLLRAQRMDSIGSLAGGIAHDLNNTLAPILLTVSMMREEEQDPTRLEDLGTIEFCAQRGADMVRQLLTFARGVDGKRVKVNVGKIASEIHKIAKDAFPKDIVFRVHLPPDVWEVNADPTQLYQLLMNLCVNARDAMPGGGELTVTVEHVTIDEVFAKMNHQARPGPYVLVRVEDSGVGMPPEIIDRIFDPFFTTKEVGKGTGLGLSTVHTIVRAHGGFLSVYSEVGKGTRFRVYLPAEVSGRIARESAAEESKLPRGNGELILVADDDEIVRAVAQRTLERYGYRVMLACDGAEAVALYSKNAAEIAVVLTDMSMPLMDGPAAIAAMKALNPAVRVIGSSGLNASSAVRAAVPHFIAKPYTAETLLNGLDQILGGR